MTKLKVTRDNLKSRLLFVDYWVNYIKSHSPKDWGSQQNLLINSQLQNGRYYPFTLKQYLEMKGEKCSR